MNEALLRGLGVGTVLGGEVEPALLSIGQRLRAEHGTECERSAQSEPVISLGRVPFEVPDRSGLPELSRYAHLVLPDGSTRVSRICRGQPGLQAPVPALPGGPGVPGNVPHRPGRRGDGRHPRSRSGKGRRTFPSATRISSTVPPMASGWRGRCTTRFPKSRSMPPSRFSTSSITPNCCPSCGAAGACSSPPLWKPWTTTSCAFSPRTIPSRDFDRAVALTRAAGIALAPTFVAFTPWTTLEGYIALLRAAVELQLVESVPPVQLIIRLLVPEGS